MLFTPTTQRRLWSPSTPSTTTASTTSSLLSFQHEKARLGEREGAEGEGEGEGFVQTWSCLSLYTCPSFDLGSLHKTRDVFLLTLNAAELLTDSAGGREPNGS